MAQPTARVEYCGDKESSICLANFTNGRLDPRAKGANDLKFACYKYIGKDHQHKGEKSLVCESSEMSYVGHETPNCSYMVAVHNKREGKIRLYDSSVLKLQPHFPEEDKDEKDNSELSFMEKADELTTAFGTVKSRRAMESRLKNTIQGESLDVAINSVVTDMLSRPDVESIVAKPVLPADNDELIPPYDKEATLPSAVYNINDILDEGEHQAMSHVADEFFNSTREDLKQWTTQQTYGTYVLKQLTMLPLEEKARRNKAIRLLYLHYMMKLFQMKAEQLRGLKAFPEEVPDIVVKSLFERFTKNAITPGHTVRRCMQSRLKDKLLAYICVLCLMLDDYSLELQALLSDLKVSVSRLLQTIKSLGCRTEQKSSDGGSAGKKIFMATLTVPLKFPELKPHTKKGRR